MVLVVASTVAWTAWGIMRHDAFGTFGFDFGIFDQGLWLLSRFHRPFVTLMGLHLFGDHTSFILLPLVPLYWVYPSAKALIGVQAAAVSVAAVPLFLLARDKLRSEWLALALAVGFLGNAALQWSDWEQFHPDVFEIPLALVALWFMTRRRWVGYFVAVALMLLVKEDVALMTIGLGVYVAAKYDRRVGAATALVSAAWLIGAVYLVLPAFNGQGTLDAWRVPYGGPGGLLRETLTHPVTVARLALGDGKPWYLWQLLAGFAGLSILAPSALLPAVGPLAFNLLSTFSYQFHIEYHYTTLITPVLAFAAVVGISRLGAPRVRTAAVASATVAGLATGWLWGPSALARHPQWLGDSSAARVQPLLALLHRVPPTASVSTDYNLVTHLDHRTNVFEFPNPWYARNWGDESKVGTELPQAATVRFVVVARNALAPREELLVEYLESTQFAEVARAGATVLLERRAAARPVDPAVAQQLRRLSGPDG